MIPPTASGRISVAAARGQLYHHRMTVTDAVRMFACERTGLSGQQQALFGKERLLPPR